MLSRSRFLFATLQRGAGSNVTRGNPVGEYGTLVNPDKAPAVPNYLKERFRLEKQRHIKDELAGIDPSAKRRERKNDLLFGERGGDRSAMRSSSVAPPRPRKYTLCTKCGITSCVINFDAVPSARVGMYGVCAGGRDYTHHRFRVIAKEDYDRMQKMTKEQRVQWVFQE